MKGFCPLASGSKGNCLYYGTDHAKILIDAGLSAKAIKNKLAEIGVLLSEIDAILVTHEHSDHIMGLATLTSHYQIPIFANSETAKAILHASDENHKFKLFTTDETFEFKDIAIHPFSVQHDTLEPVAFTLKSDTIKLGVCADLGFATTLVQTNLQNCDYLYLEANHEISMVHACSRPMIYKQRVLGRHGHLSNEDSGKLLSKILHDNLKHVYLAHLSSECNSPEKALSVVKSHLPEQVPCTFSIAWQDRISSPLHF